MSSAPHYVVQCANPAPPMEPDWQHPSWSQAETLQIIHFRPEGSDHRPVTSARLLCDPTGIHGIFHVEDRYVRCVRANYFAEVWKDSCVEFFAEPKPGRGYFNFEFNCGGAFKEFTKMPAGLGKTIQVRSSLPAIVEPEIQTPVAWTLRFFIPFTLFQHYIGPLGPIGGQVWRGNFYKCAEEVSHPHWASWSPVDKFDFHRPNCFGTIEFSGKSQKNTQSSRAATKD
jgi:hypothetical protein